MRCTTRRKRRERRQKESKTSFWIVCLSTIRILEADKSWDSLVAVAAAAVAAAVFAVVGPPRVARGRERLDLLEERDWVQEQRAAETGVG